jgi:hypothetical protein
VKGGPATWWVVAGKNKVRYIQRKAYLRPKRRVWTRHLSFFGALTVAYGVMSWQAVLRSVGGSR